MFTPLKATSKNIIEAAAAGREGPSTQQGERVYLTQFESDCSAPPMPEVDHEKATKVRERMRDRGRMRNEVAWSLS